MQCLGPLIYNTINTTVCLTSVNKLLRNVCHNQTMWKMDQLLQLIAPFDCLCCGQEADLLCPSCLPKLPLPPGQCYRCLKTADVVCQSCLTKTDLSGVFVATNYQDAPAGLVHALKFERAQAAAKLIAQAIHQRLPRLPANCVVCHIPTANVRVRQRGYDQARLIAKALACYRDVQHATVLWRRGKNRQVGANRQQRLNQLQTALVCLRPQMVVGRTVVLVDDVLTTGATIETAARVLKKTGATEVIAVLFAQKI